MNSRRRTLLLAGVGVGAVGAGLALGQWLSRSSAADLSGLVFPDLQGRPQAISQWSGKTVVLNFWAPWCEPCREEIPALIKVQNKLAQDVQILGISLDNVEKISEFAVKWSINYPLLLGGLQAMETMRNSGNPAGVLPYSLILDAKGQAVRNHLGVLTEPEWEGLLRQMSAT